MKIRLGPPNLPASPHIMVIFEGGEFLTLIFANPIFGLHILTSNCAQVSETHIQTRLPLKQHSRRRQRLTSLRKKTEGGLNS